MDKDKIVETTLDDNIVAYLLSYPKSGNSWLRYIIEYMTGIPFISEKEGDGSFFYFTGGISSPYSPSSISEKAYKFPDGVDIWSYLSQQNNLTNQQRCLPGNFPNCESCSQGGWPGRLNAPYPREGANICEECNKKDESVSQNLIKHGYKVCDSCYTSKTIFPI